MFSHRAARDAYYAAGKGVELVAHRAARDVDRRTDSLEIAPDRTAVDRHVAAASGVEIVRQIASGIQRKVLSAAHAKRHRIDRNVDVGGTDGGNRRLANGQVDQAVGIR